jgi:hypothetical protein
MQLLPDEIRVLQLELDRLPTCLLSCEIQPAEPELPYLPYRAPTIEAVMQSRDNARTDLDAMLHHGSATDRLYAAIVKSAALDDDDAVSGALLSPDTIELPTGVGFSTAYAAVRHLALTYLEQKRIFCDYLRILFLLRQGFNGIKHQLRVPTLDQVWDVKKRDHNNEQLAALKQELMRVSEYSVVARLYAALLFEHIDAAYAHQLFSSLSHDESTIAVLMGKPPLVAFSVRAVAISLRDEGKFPATPRKTSTTQLAERMHEFFKPKH